MSSIPKSRKQIIDDMTRLMVSSTPATDVESGSVMTAFYIFLEGEIARQNLISLLTTLDSRFKR